MGLKKNLKYVALTVCAYGGAVMALAGIGEVVNEFYKRRERDITPHAIYATESVGRQGKITLDWHEGSGAWLCYSEKGHGCDRKYFADNPLGENIKSICDKFGCVDVGNDGFDEKLESAKQDWAGLCQKIDCRRLYAVSQGLREL